MTFLSVHFSFQRESNSPLNACSWLHVAPATGLACNQWKFSPLCFLLSFQVSLSSASVYLHVRLKGELQNMSFILPWVKIEICQKQSYVIITELNVKADRFPRTKPCIFSRSRCWVFSNPLFMDTLWNKVRTRKRSGDLYLAVTGNYLKYPTKE